MRECGFRDSLISEYLRLGAELQSAEAQLPGIANRPEQGPLLETMIRLRVEYHCMRRRLVEHCQQHGC